MALQFADIKGGRKADIARALSQIEGKDGTLVHAGLIDAATIASRAHVIGLTGPPGVGKSTLTNALVNAWRAQNISVAVVAVDPSSRVTGGALLGDRTRITTDPDDAGVFVRSFAARDRLGGLSEHAIAAIRLLSAFYDRVLVESVGIGQSESDLAFAVDTTILCVQPGSGDSLQFMKAGIMELPDIVLVTKSDMGRDAKRALADVEGALSLSGRRAESTRSDIIHLSTDSSTGQDASVLLVSSETGEGLVDVLAACEAHRAYLGQAGRLKRKREAQDQHWLHDAVRRQFGAQGLKVLGDKPGALQKAGLYGAIARAFQSLQVTVC